MFWPGHVSHCRVRGGGRAPTQWVQCLHLRSQKGRILLCLSKSFNHTAILLKILFEKVTQSRSHLSCTFGTVVLSLNQKFGLKKEIFQVRFYLQLKRQGILHSLSFSYLLKKKKKKKLPDKHRAKFFSTVVPLYPLTLKGKIKLQLNKLQNCLGFSFQNS